MDRVPRHWEFEEVFDALELGCGQLLLDLNLFIRPKPPGARILLASRDAASPIEVPAWCRNTGHRLLEAHHPFYWIERRLDRQPKED